MRKLKLVGCLVLCAALTACQTPGTLGNSNGGTIDAQVENNQTSEGDETVLEISTEITQRTGDYSDKAIAAEWDDSTASHISLSETAIEVEGDGMEVEDTTVTIIKGGTYVISGTLADGQIMVNLTEDENVQLVLNGVDITCSTGAPIVAYSAKNIYMTLADGTENVVRDSGNYVFTEGEDEPSAVIFSKDDLIINGNGSLSVFGNCKDGITSKDDLQIIDGTISISAKDDGIVGKDSVEIRNGVITIEAGGDGIKSTNAEEAEKGYVVIDGGTFDITSGADGLQAETFLNINDGTFTILSGGGSKNVTEKSADGGFSEKIKLDGTESISAKALKASYNIGIFGGTFAIDSADDSIHSNQAIVIEAGVFTIEAGDDGIHSDTLLTINDGEVTIVKSYEGLESHNIAINGGTITVAASDDGVNIAGGNDTSTESNGWGKDEFAAIENATLTINGGVIDVNANGDGLDSNGDIVMNGGMVTVYGPTDDGNAALDYNGTLDVNDGTLLVAGSSGMAQTTSDTSTQAAIAAGFTSKVSGGTKVSVTDSTGKEIYSYVPEKDFSMVLISGERIHSGENYTITAGNETVSLSGGETTGLNTMGGHMGGR